MSKSAMDRYRAALHAMQSGVMAKMNINPTDTTPKNLRVGINSALVCHFALAKLLIDKKIITEDEYAEAIADAMEQEVKSFEAWLTEHIGDGTTNITLG